MSHSRYPQQLFYEKLALWGIILSCIALTLGAYRDYAARPATSVHPALPFGLEWIERDNGVALRDFPLMWQFCRQVWNRKIERPYSTQGQREIFRNWMPELKKGMPVAYAPTVILWYGPFVLLGPEAAFVAFCILSAGLFAALAKYYLLPRIQSVEQARYLLISLFSISALSCFRIGQNPFVTTAIIAAAWWIIYDFNAQKRRALNWKHETALAGLLLIMTAKPNLAVVLGGVYVAARLWRPLLGAAAAALILCALLSDRFGGWPQWAHDYLALVSDYHQTGLGEFLYYGPELSTNLMSYLIQMCALEPEAASHISKIVWLGAMAVLILLHWRKKITPQQFFILNFANFLLFCPSLSGTDDWTICLIIAEAPFFWDKRHFWLKALALVLAVDFYQAHRTLWEFTPLPFPAKLTLLVWALCHAQQARLKR
jgi:hypothetical protein